MSWTRSRGADVARVRSSATLQRVQAPHAPQGFPGGAAAYRSTGCRAHSAFIGMHMEQFHGTTIVSVRLGDKVALGGDGQVTLGNIVMKGGAKKVRRIYGGKVLVGFAGGTADAFSLLDRFEAKLEKHQGNLTRAAVELAKDWRTDRMLRRLEAMLIAADATATLVLTGNGDVLEPENGICAIGSGGSYAQAAALALMGNTELSARDIVEKSLEIAGDMCIYTNHSRIIETIETGE